MSSLFVESSFDNSNLLLVRYHFDISKGVGSWLVPALNTKLCELMGKSAESDNAQYCKPATMPAEKTDKEEIASVPRLEDLKVAEEDMLPSVPLLPPLTELPTPSGKKFVANTINYSTIEDMLPSVPLLPPPLTELPTPSGKKFVANTIDYSKIDFSDVKTIWCKPAAVSVSTLGLKIASSISLLGSIVRVLADGNCGYRSCQKILQFFNNAVISSMQELRHQLYDLVIERYEDLPSLIRNMEGETHCNFKNEKKSSAHDYECLDQIYTPGESLEGGEDPMDALDEYYWMTDHVLLPLFALKFKMSFVFYTTLDESTVMFLYSHMDGTVKYVECEEGYASSPDVESVAIVYNGTNHYEWLRPRS